MIRAKEKKMPMTASSIYTHQNLPPSNLTSSEKEIAAMDRNTTSNPRASVMTSTVNSGKLINSNPTRAVSIPNNMGHNQRVRAFLLTSAKMISMMPAIKNAIPSSVARATMASWGLIRIIRPVARKIRPTANTIYQWLIDCFMVLISGTYIQ